MKMTAQSNTLAAEALSEHVSNSRSSWRDYLEMCKPKVVLMMILTSAIGMMLASSGLPDLNVMIFGNIGIALMAGSAAAINHVVDRKVDTLMSRTKNRPLAKGKVSVVSGLVFAMLLGLLGMALLIIQINPLTAWLTFASLIGYAVVYTLFLKRATPQNIVIGGIAGAAPPLLGWTSVTGVIDPNSLLLVLIIFAWTPPHFWALAIHRKAEYAKADIPMLPVTHGEAYTKIQILLYTFILFAVSLFPFITGMSGYLYLVSALALGSRFIYWAVVMIKNSRPNAPINTFKFSITYLMLLFVALLFDHYLLEMI